MGGEQSVRVKRQRHGTAILKPVQLTVDGANLETGQLVQKTVEEEPRLEPELAPTLLLLTGELSVRAKKQRHGTAILKPVQLTVDGVNLETGQLVQKTAEEEPRLEPEPEPTEEEMMATCRQDGKRILGSPLSPPFYDGLGTFAGCYQKCKQLADCHAFVWVENTQGTVKRCFVKAAGYAEPTPETVEGRISAALEMCCMDNSC